MSTVRLILRGFIFLSSMLLTIPLLIILRLFGRFPRAQFAIYSAWRGLFLGAMGIRVHYTGNPYSHPALLVANHRSYADVLFVPSLTPVVFLAKIEIRHWPLIGWGARAMDTVFVDRSTKDSRRAARVALRDRMSHGESAIVFPEGTTTAQGLNPLHPGMFVVAAEESWPVVAYAMEYSDPDMAWVGHEAFVTHMVRMLKRPMWHVNVIISEPMTHSDPDQLMENVRKWMVNAIETLRPGSTQNEEKENP